jgi:hypothetical protein
MSSFILFVLFKKKRGINRKYGLFVVDIGLVHGCVGFRLIRLLVRNPD